MYYLDSADIHKVMCDFPEYDAVIRGRVLGEINSDHATIAVHRRKSLLTGADAIRAGALVKKKKEKSSSVI